MKLNTIYLQSRDLNPFQLKLAIFCCYKRDMNLIYRCRVCPYNDPCTREYVHYFDQVPNEIKFPENFMLHINTNNYRKLHNLPKKRKGVDYFA